MPSVTTYGLGIQWFRSIEEARYKIDQWRHHCNRERPNSSLNYLTSVAFAEKEGEL
ncbi:integrase core domain-containing protein [Marinagarivorans algicola]|uniref:integrase core domain-containing protein n=1 Tax=Marinagarivorans algicola TaxID=1513270 RepID=UPI0009E69DDF